MSRNISENSLFIEMTLQHLLLAKLSQVVWKKKKSKLLEIAAAEIDNKGFDVVLTVSKVTRHVQLKCLKLDARRRKIDVNVGLLDKPSGCVLLCEYNPSDLEFTGFYFYGNSPGKRLPDIRKLPVALNSRRSLKERTLRKNVRNIPRNRFVSVNSLERVFEKLFVD
jgi:hypothetical protein